MARRKQARMAANNTRAGKRRLGIQSVEIGARVLFELANHGRPASLAELARRLAMPPSNVRRYLVSLVTAGLVEQDPETLAYALGVSCIRVGLTALGQRSEVELVTSAARQLRSRVNCCVGVLCPGESGPVMIYWLENDERVTHVGKIGATFSRIHSAAGRIFLAFAQDSEVETAYRTESVGGMLPTEAGRRLDLAAFKAMLRRTRAREMSHVKGDYSAGIEAVGAPVLNAAGEVVFAVTLLGRIGLFDQAPKNAAPDELSQTTRRVSAMLGYAASGATIAFPAKPLLSLRDI